MSSGGQGAQHPVLSRWIGPLSGVAPPVPASRHFVLAGIEWQAPERPRIELRAHRVAGGWTPWVRAAVLGHDAEGGEAIAHALVGDPIWTGLSDAVQLRSGAPVEGVNLHLVLASAVTGAGQERAIATAAAGVPLAAPDLPTGPGQPPIIARRAWAGGLLPRVVPAYGDVQMAFVHHSVNANGYSSAEVPAMLRSIYYFHTYVRGWNDFGYNFAVDAYGRIWEGRAGGIDRPVVGAQAGGYNLESFGAVLLGDFAATMPTPAARQALARLVAWKLALHGVPVSGRVTVEVDPSDAFYTPFRPGQRVALPRIAGHRDGCSTDCPGNDMYVYGMPALRSTVARLVGGRLHRLTLAVGPGRGSAYALAPYPIAPGTRIKPAVPLQLETVTMTSGRQLPLHGALRSLSGVPLRSATILLQDLSANRESEHQAELSRAVTGRDGGWAVELKPHTNLLLRALHADAPAAASALIVLGVAPELTLALIPAGARAVRAQGTVTPGKRHIQLEVRAVGAGRHATKHMVRAEGGRFDEVLRLAPGRYWVTAQTMADATNLAGASPPVAAHI